MRLLLYTQVVDQDHPILGFMHGWIIEFSRHFDAVDIICLAKGKYELPSHVTVHSLGKEDRVSKLRQLIRFYVLTWQLQKLQPDFVFYHMGAIMNVLGAPFYLFSQLSRTPRRYLWWKAHGHINWFGRLALWFVDEVVTSTESGFPIDTKKRRVVGQAVDLSRFRCAEVSRKPRHVLFIGRITPIKHLEVFIAAARLLHDTDSSYTFSITGQHDSYVYYDSLMQLCKSKGLNTNMFNGPQIQDELVREYCVAGIFLNPSETHSMDKTVLEAMACGAIPLTANRAFVDLLGPLGLYNTENDPTWYAARITELSTTDQDALRATLRTLVEKQHSLATFGERVFGDCIKKKPV